jgi:hypothetical protein
MATINASEDAFRKILKRKREMEEESQKVVTIAHALDSLLGGL